MSVIKNECKNFPYISLGTSTDLKQLIQQEILLVFIHKNQKVHLSEELNLFIEKILLTYQNNWFEGKTITFYATLKTGLQRVVLVGLPDKKDLSSNVLRKLTGNAARVIAELPETSIGIYCDYLFDATKEDYLSAILEGMLLGAYTFTELKSQQKEVQFKELLILSKIEKCADLLKEAYILSSNIAWSRNLINRPGNLVKPETLAEEAVAIAAEYDLSIEVLAEKELEAKGMGAILAVGQGSAAESKMITIKYEGAVGAPWIALVGKGITFDTGGISLKPEAGMGEMKDDMSGAATVLGVMKTIAALGVACNVIGICACAENMPSGTAMRPGDIITAGSGKTIEVISTDAEGRLVLADAVWYACRQGASKVIDIATLTGAVIIALGNETAGIVTNNEELYTEIKQAGQKCGESYWQLPSLPECKEAIKSDIADLLNSAGRPGGTITGGLFIGEFVDKNIPWAHLDIGGTACTEKNKGILTKGATGFGIATLYKLLKGHSYEG